jgi:hypothetical protein
MIGFRLLGVVAAGLLLACTGRPSHQTVTSYPPAPAGLDTGLSTYLEAAKAHPRHVWRDTEPLNAGGAVNGYVEIPKRGVDEVGVPHPAESP